MNASFDGRTTDSGSTLLLYPLFCIMEIEWS